MNMNLLRKSSRKAGFTLVEIMVVIVILGTLMTLLFVAIPKNPTGDIEKKVASNRIKAALFQFESQCGRLPTSDEGLPALVEGPSDIESCAGKNFLPIKFIQNKNKCVYKYELKETGDYSIADLGADCQEGGEGNNADTSFDNM